MSVLVGDSQQPDGSNESYIQTQQMTQTQQVDSQNAESANDWDQRLWGVLISVNTPTVDALESQPEGYVARPQMLELKNGQTEYLIGRHPRADLKLDSQKISSKHATIFLDKQGGSQVKLIDTSTNGTYVRGSKVGKGNTTVLETGDEIIFGVGTTSFVADFRYFFRGPDSASNASKPWGLRDSSGGGIHAKYEVREQIGKGSFATVRKGIQRSTGKMVAVKIVQKARFAANPKTMEMIRREVDIMKKIDHEYCVRYIDYFEDDQRMWLVMEYVDGGDLLDYVMKAGGLSESETREIAIMVCQAVTYLHSKGVAHRDLKPENLLLSSGQRPVCKVTDFGLAKMVDGNTMLKTMCGTPTYLAPEVILGQSPSAGYDTIVDAWSIGVILYSCMTNQVPFDESESTPLPQRMRERKVDWSTLQEANISRDATDFLTKLLQKDPRRRMRVQDALSHPWLASQPVSGFLSSANLARPALAANPSLSAMSKDVATTNASSGSFGYSQGLERMRLDDTPARSAAASVHDDVMTDAADQSNDIKSIGVPSPPHTNILDASNIDREQEAQASATHDRKREPRSAFSSDSENASGTSAMCVRPNGSMPFDIPPVSRPTATPRNGKTSEDSENDHSMLIQSADAPRRSMRSSVNAGRGAKRVTDDAVMTAGSSGAKRRKKNDGVAAASEKVETESVGATSAAESSSKPSPRRTSRRSKASDTASSTSAPVATHAMTTRRRKKAAARNGGR